MTDRRSFLRGASVLMGHAAFGQVMTAFAAAPRKATFFTDPEMVQLRALVDVILPATDSPAASAADTHYFIDLAIPACASAAAQKTFREGLKVPGNVDLWSTWDAIRVPTLLIRGERSDLLPADVAAQMTQRGPKAELVTLPGVGHAPTLVPAAQVELVRAFLERD